MSLVLRFSETSSVNARLIKLYTWSWCSHVEVELDIPSGLVLYGALPGVGVDFRSPLSTNDATRIERYAIEMSIDNEDQFRKELLSQKGKPYDWTALIGMAIHRDWGEDETKWFCSELIAWASIRASAPLIRAEHVDRVTPRDLLLSPRLTRIS